MDNVTIRPIQRSDAEKFLALSVALDNETTFMMFEPGERTTTVAEQERAIDAMLVSGNQLALVAVSGDELSGYVGVYGGEFRRNRHVAYIVAGVLQRFAGQGIGTRLFQAAEEWSRAHGIIRMELTVMIDNAAGIRLYEKSGFSIEGRRPRSMRISGRLVDEFYMGKILE